MSIKSCSCVSFSEGSHKKRPRISSLFESRRRLGVQADTTRADEMLMFWAGTLLGFGS